MKYLKHYFAQSSGAESSSIRPRCSTFQTSNTSKSKRTSSFEDNLAESCIQTKKMIDDYENQVGAMKKKRRDRNGGGYNVYTNIISNNNNNNVYTASKQKKKQQQQQQMRGGDRYQVYGGNRKRYAKFKQPVLEVLDDGGDTDSLTSLTDDLTYLHQSARRETASAAAAAAANLQEDTASIFSIPGSAANPLDVTAVAADDTRDEDRYAGGSSVRNDHNTRSGRFSSKRWKDSIRQRRSLLKDDDDDDDDDHDGENNRNDDVGEADEDWPGARIPLPTAAAKETVPSRKQKQQKQQKQQTQQSQRQQPKSDTQSDSVQSTIQRLMNEFSAVLGETHTPKPTSSLKSSSSRSRISAETERLKRSLRDQRQKFDQEKGALHTELGRIKRDHGMEVDRLQSDLRQAQESHQMYLKKLTEVVDYHEVLHEKETATMNKIVEQVKKEKRDEVTTLTRALEKLKSSSSSSSLPSSPNYTPNYSPNRYHPVQTTWSSEEEDPDDTIRECLQYLSDASDDQQHRRSQFMDTMVALQSIALRSTGTIAGRGFTERDIQDMDGLLDMLHHVYTLSETSHQNTLSMSHMLVEECTRISHQTGRMADYSLDPPPPPPPPLSPSSSPMVENHRLDFLQEYPHEQQRQKEEEEEEETEAESILTRVEEEDYRQERQLDLRRQQEVYGGGGGGGGAAAAGNSLDEFTQTMERNLYRGLGLIP